MAIDELIKAFYQTQTLYESIQQDLFHLFIAHSFNGTQVGKLFQYTTFDELRE
jgi:hypothetical protein